MTRYLLLNTKDESIFTTRNDYNKLRLKWNNLSSDERSTLNNNGAQTAFSFRSFDGEVLDVATIRNRRGTQEIGFIEIDHE